MPISKLTSPKTAPAALMAAFLVAASANAKDEASPYQETPERHVFDGETDDLLTAGWPLYTSAAADEQSRQ